MSFQSETPLGTEIKNGTTDTIGDNDNITFERSGFATPFKELWSSVKSSLQAFFNSVYLQISNNLSDLNNVITARNNLKVWDIYITSGDQATTSNVASNITGLVTPTLSANKRYYIEGFIVLGCNGVGGVKLQVGTLPTGATIKIQTFGRGANNSSFLRASLQSGNSLGTAFNILNNSDGGVYISGEINMSSTTGTIQFGFASGTNTQTSTIYQLGTVLILRQLN